MKSIKTKALELLAIREHSKKELVQKLQKYASVRKIEDCLLELEKADMQSDFRYACFMVRAKASKGQGPVKIRFELAKKGVKQYHIEDALSEEKVDWSILAQQVALKKIRMDKLNVDQHSDLIRLKSFLARRGFQMDTIEHLIEDIAYGIKQDEHYLDQLQDKLFAMYQSERESTDSLGLDKGSDVDKIGSELSEFIDKADSLVKASDLISAEEAGGTANPVEVEEQTVFSSEEAQKENMKAKSPT